MRTAVFDTLVIESPVMKALWERLRAFASTDATVLVTWETGTGKGLVARTIHCESSRRDRGFVTFPCGAVPELLTESELFGHERGAYTSADNRVLGKVSLAQGGTLFLDEIDNLSLPAQAKLLHLLDDKEYFPLGCSVLKRADIRVIAAANRDLSRLCAQGAFREDLFYRLNVIAVHVPPLRERPEDIPVLAGLFLELYGKAAGKKVGRLSQEGLAPLLECDWPGNVRELRNVIEHAVILERSEACSLEALAAAGLPSAQAGWADHPGKRWTIAEARRLGVSRVETAYLTRLMGQYPGRLGEAAQTAGVTPRQLYYLLRKHGISSRPTSS